MNRIVGVGVLLTDPDGRVLLGERVTAAVTMLRGADAPQVTEPHVFRSWQWFALDRLPSPLFPATALVLAVPASGSRDGLYRITPPAARP
ncbi:hypothetical protein ABZ815_18205 [Nonomuraea sp. NPDC047529]|uniref:hypothetical protein n=1 Tax=Nonomuraea sp. NPDC047529 TaxID=3155623 RepID=UPI003404CFA4